MVETKQKKSQKKSNYFLSEIKIQDDQKDKKIKRSKAKMLSVSVDVCVVCVIVCVMAMWGELRNLLYLPLFVVIVQ